ncbi:hypothetical protein HYV82_02480 [Candidatus Woesearchaeota archaeon]|nr:hypothetical protein [Candidatus Woesearchaeota archaeon]
MAKRWKVKCDCGSYFEEKDTEVEGIPAKCMMCPNCSHKTFTIDQAKEILKLMKLKELVKSKKKIIRIGNSKGITLPQGLNANVGDVAVMEVVSPDSFLIKIRSAAKH